MARLTCLLIISDNTARRKHSHLANEVGEVSGVTGLSRWLSKSRLGGLAHLIGQGVGPMTGARKARSDSDANFSE